jgi:hypothetical protein
MSEKPSKVMPFPPPRRPDPVTLAPAARPPAPMLVERPPGVDLSGKVKAVFFIGRGRTGKTTLARWAYEVLAERGGSAIIAAADPTNRALVNYLDEVAQPPSTDPLEVRDWLLALLQHAMSEKLSVMVDMGGGDTSLLELLKVLPNLATLMTEGGVEPVAIHAIGTDPHDLHPLAITEEMGFQPKATALVLNEVYARGGQRHRFDEVTTHPVYHTAVNRGAVPVWMPALIEEVARYCARDGGRFLDLPRSKPFFAQALKNWLGAMSAEFSPIAAWWP